MPSRCKRAKCGALTKVAGKTCQRCVSLSGLRCFQHMTTKKTFSNPNPQPQSKSKPLTPWNNFLNDVKSQIPHAFEREPFRQTLRNFANLPSEKMNVIRRKEVIEKLVKVLTLTEIEQLKSILKKYSSLQNLLDMDFIRHSILIKKAEQNDNIPKEKLVGNQRRKLITVLDQANKKIQYLAKRQPWNTSFRNVKKLNQIPWETTLLLLDDLYQVLEKEEPSQIYALLDNLDYNEFVPLWDFITSN